MMAQDGLFRGLQEPNHLHISSYQTHVSHVVMIQKRIAVEVVAVAVVVDVEQPRDS